MARGKHTTPSCVLGRSIHPVKARRKIWHFTESKRIDPDRKNIRRSGQCVDMALRELKQAIRRGLISVPSDAASEAPVKELMA